MKTLNLTSKLMGIAAGAAMALTAGIASADSYPSKPISLVVPFGAGGGSDTAARIYQKAFQDNDLLGQPMTVFNVPGAGGSVGARQVKDTDADGYTFLLIHIALLTRQAAELIDFGYQDFELVAGTEVNSSVLVVREDSPYKTLDDLIAAAKAKPESIVFGVNLGANKHMQGIQVEEAAGVKFRFAQIGGDSKNVSALRGGHIEVTTLSIGSYKKLGEGFRALAYYGKERLEGVDIPTFKEQGHDISYTVQNWWFAPKGTPQAAIDHFAGAIKAASETDYVKETFAGRNSPTQYVDGQAFADLVAATYAKVEPLAKIAAQAKK